MRAARKISLSVVKRLPRYYRYLGELLADKITRISSKELSERMAVTASQIRQDLNNFGCFGQQGYGYNVEQLYCAIKDLLGLSRGYETIIVGAGNIGQSIVKYKTFEKRGFFFKAMFDIDEELIGQSVVGVPVYSVDDLEKYLSAWKIDIAVLSLPKTEAENIFQTIVGCGVKGIWNFSHMDLVGPPSVKIENVHLTDSLMTLSYRLNEAEDT